MKKAESLLDFILIFGILVAVTVGFTRIWVWFNVNLAKRNVDYQITRINAGTASDSHLSSLAYQDAKLPIDDNWIFRGVPSGKVGMTLPVSYMDINPTTEFESDPLAGACASARAAAASLRNQADDMDSQADKMQWLVDIGEDWYSPFYWIFLLLGIDIDSYKQAIEGLRKGAQDTRAQAASLESQICGGNPE